jgi:CheY-like chemotaxis protein
VILSDAPRTVLIADDDETQRALYADVLRINGLTVLEAGDGTEAVDVALREVPAVVLLDLVMPGMNGIEVATILTNDPATANVPIIAISGLISRDMREKAVAAGCVNYLQKPYTPMALLAEVRHWLARGKGGAPGGQK